jgi:hypothetical protein
MESLRGIRRRTMRIVLSCKVVRGVEEGGGGLLVCFKASRGDLAKSIEAKNRRRTKRTCTEEDYCVMVLLEAYGCL